MLEHKLSSRLLERVLDKIVCYLWFRFKSIDSDSGRSFTYENTSTTAFVAPATSSPNPQNPAIVYLAGLSIGSRRTMRQALNTIAGIVTNNQLDLTTLPWGVLRFQHTQAVRAALQDRFSPATANKMLSALRHTLRIAWNLGHMSAEEYQRAVDISPVTGERESAAAGKRRLRSAGDNRSAPETFHGTTRARR